MGDGGKEAEVSPGSVTSDCHQMEVGSARAVATGLWVAGAEYQSV